MLLDKIEQLLNEVSNLKASNAGEIEQLRLKYLSKKGEINELMAEFRNVAADQKRTVGMKINELKKAATEKINELKAEAEEKEGDESGLDLTRSPYPVALGTRHPLTIVKDEIIEIFQRASRSSMDRRLTTTSTCSRCSTSLPTIRHATCRTPSSSRRTRTT